MGPLLPILGEIFKGAAIRNAFSGGFTGAASRIGLYAYAKGEADKKGEKLPVSPGEAAGALAQDYGTLGRSILGLAGNIRELSSSYAQENRGMFAPYSKQYAIADELRRDAVRMRSRAVARATEREEMSLAESESVAQKNQIGVDILKKKMASWWEETWNNTLGGMFAAVADELGGGADAKARELKIRGKEAETGYIKYGDDTVTNQLMRDLADGKFVSQGKHPIPDMQTGWPNRKER